MKATPVWSHVSASGWDEEYRAGRWEYLTSSTERARYGVIAGLIHTNDARRVLDVGCGVATLLRHLGTGRIASYVGIDVSMEALARVTPAPGTDCRFVAASAEDFSPPAGELFDVVVFNESLYYVDAPVKVVRRYSRFLLPGGSIIVSMHLPAAAISMMWRHRVLAIWRALGRQKFPVPAAVALHCPSSSLRWDIRMFLPDVARVTSSAHGIA